MEPGSTELRGVFLRLMEQYGAALRRLAGAYVPSSADREDLVQEIAAAIWKGLPGFRGASSERTWLYRVAHNTALTAAARHRRRGRFEAPLRDQVASGGPGGGADQHLIREQQRQALARAIRRLPATDRQVIVLHLEGLSYSEIHEITGATEGAIGARLTRIRERLTQEIQNKEVNR